MPIVAVNSRNDDGTPILKEGEQLLSTQPQVALYFHHDTPEGNGTLYVTTMNVIWLSQDNTKGYSIDFPYISLHAVSRDTTHFAHQCLYCQLDVEVPEEDDDEDEEEEGEGMSDGKPANGTAASSQISEARFVPADPSVLSTMFDAFSQGASLNPDEEKEDEGDFFYNEDEVNRNLAALEGAIQLPGEDNSNGDDQFADADDNDEEMSG